jgi:alkylhydroperoxidase/carboxymuconolactone decarboxylase family protein YurZ
MENQLQYYTETGKYRDIFDENLPDVMKAYSVFRKTIYQDGALNLKIKRLIALACAL